MHSALLLAFKVRVRSRLEFQVRFMFSMKATKIDEIFTVDLTLCSKCQIDGEDFVNFCGLLSKHELYISTMQWKLFGSFHFKQDFIYSAADLKNFGL